MPRWSADILSETRKVQLTRFKFDEELANYWNQEVTAAFPESEIVRYQSLIAECTNHPKDRHVLAAAIRGTCDSIVTFNLRDFPKESLEPWDIEAVSPTSFLLSLYDMHGAVVATKLDDMANHRKMSRQEFLSKLYRSLPGFAGRLACDLEIDLSNTGSPEPAK